MCVRDYANQKAWCFLGKCNAENEIEDQCIAALNRSIHLDPYCLDSLLMLGVSHTNDLEKVLQTIVSHVAVFGFACAVCVCVLIV